MAAFPPPLGDPGLLAPAVFGMALTSAHGWLEDLAGGSDGAACAAFAAASSVLATALSERAELETMQRALIRA